MKKLPANDPHNWVFQANIHAAAMNGTVDTTWDTCQHSSWYFLPWHRAYIWYFEKIIQKQSGDPTFALPYWNRTLGESRNLPALFRDNTSQLFDMKRDAGVNDGSKTVTDSWMSQDYLKAMNAKDFFFCRRSEGRHDVWGRQSCRADAFRAGPRDVGVKSAQQRSWLVWSN
ncbi:MAG: hypothetical protein EXR98_20090 [Gemmataceae bacterium]|nr:hypothetical protein [Gemmataceae bacterium]